MPRVLVRTTGCQMNVHDSEKIVNLLLHRGWSRASELDQADLLLINTCSIREKAEHHLYSDLGQLREWKAGGTDRVLAVGGCVAQQEGDTLLRRFPHVDFVFGTHSLRWVPDLAEAALEGIRAVRVEETRSLDRFDWPERHPDFPDVTPGRAFLTVMEGCDLFCSFCIVPRTRGREISRPADGILAEARTLVAGGVRELTLLGQTVNAYGRHARRREEDRRSRGIDPGADSTIGFADLLRALAEIPGLERIRYTSPHPIFYDTELVQAHAEVDSLCPHVHLPAQSGSNSVLARMRRRYTREEYLAIAEALRSARPDLVLTSDLIVGFPGESDRDFQETLSLVREAGLVDSFSFKYSPRPGTSAADLPDAVAPAVAQERLEELQTLQREQTISYHRSRVGQRTEVLVIGPSRHGGRQLSGRDPTHRVVNFEAPEAVTVVPGTLHAVDVVAASPHSLIGTSASVPPAQRAELIGGGISIEGPLP